jgi:hypothetical protein
LSERLGAKLERLAPSATAVSQTAFLQRFRALASALHTR